MPSSRPVTKTFKYFRAYSTLVQLHCSKTSATVVDVSTLGTKVLTSLLFLPRLHGTVKATIITVDVVCRFLLGLFRSWLFLSTSLFLVLCSSRFPVQRLSLCCNFLVRTRIRTFVLDESASCTISSTKSTGLPSTSFSCTTSMRVYKVLLCYKM